MATSRQKCSYGATCTLKRRFLKANVLPRHIESHCRQKHRIDDSASKSICLVVCANLSMDHLQIQTKYSVDKDIVFDQFSLPISYICGNKKANYIFASLDSAERSFSTDPQILTIY